MRKGLIVALTLIMLVITTSVGIYVWQITRPQLVKITLPVAIQLLDMVYGLSTDIDYSVRVYKGREYYETIFLCWYIGPWYGKGAYVYPSCSNLTLTVFRDNIEWDSINITLPMIMSNEICFRKNNVDVCVDSFLIYYDINLGTNIKFDI